jgi:hypothetical protein
MATRWRIVPGIPRAKTFEFATDEPAPDASEAKVPEEVGADDPTLDASEAKVPEEVGADDPTLDASEAKAPEEVGADDPTLDASEAKVPEKVGADDPTLDASLVSVLGAVPALQDSVFGSPEQLTNILLTSKSLHNISVTKCDALLSCIGYRCPQDTYCKVSLFAKLLHNPAGKFGEESLLPEGGSCLSGLGGEFE